MLLLAAGLSSGQKAGIAVVAGIFIVFALTVSMLIPRRWPNFPTAAGLRPFLVASFALFVGMMLAVIFLAKESESEAAPPPKAGTAAYVAKVDEVDFAIKLKANSGPAGDYTFQISNDGKSVHNLTVEGEGIEEASPNLQPGKEGSLHVKLKPGKYELYCSVDGHKGLGMDLEFTVT